MKSSNILVMVESVRLLVQMMQKEGFACPLHLGVTEAGEGEDGRIRSALGIGALLAEGIGDTVRVSLSEPPENEIPVARLIVESALRHTLRAPGSGPAPGNAHIKIDSGEPTLFLKYDIADASELAVVASVDAAPVLLPRKATALRINNGSLLPAEVVSSVEDGILQAARIKITRNDYISCPTCGRTRFDLPAVVAAVKKATAHLTGLKIAVMGCVVNGPGEMADADYGYVGAAEGKVHIYRGTEAVLKNVPVDEAIAKLLGLIESDQAKR
jgi:(E)-4-hydroxy-3-methylbut-2-enyl-diphosphate synthase